MRCSVLRRMNPLVAPFSSGSSTHHFGSDWRKSGHSRRMLKPTRLTRIGLATAQALGLAGALPRAARPGREGLIGFEMRLCCGAATLRFVLESDGLFLRL